MNSYYKISEVLEQDIVKEMGFSQEQFNSLPFLYQAALLDECIKAKLKWDNKQENVKRDKLEKNVKKKILSIFNKK